MKAVAHCLCLKKLNLIKSRFIEINIDCLGRDNKRSLVFFFKFSKTPL